MAVVKVLFVCLGNICRSPTAHGVFQKMVDDANLQQQVLVDSAGTAAWHIGKSPDKRSISVAAQRGYDLSVLRARQACADDFYDFDYILAMDHSNFSDLQALQPTGAKAKLELFLQYAQTSAEASTLEVPDPYYGGGDGFQQVLDLAEQASTGLLTAIMTYHKGLNKTCGEQG